MKAILIIILGMHVFCNAFSQKNMLFLCKNPNGITESMKLNMENTGKIKAIVYNSSKSKSSINLMLDKQQPNYCEVKFPGDKSIYKLSITESTIICSNPDGTKQTFIFCNTITGKYKIDYELFSQYIEFFDNGQCKYYLNICEGFSLETDSYTITNNIIHIKNGDYDLFLVDENTIRFDKNASTFFCNNLTDGVQLKK